MTRCAINRFVTLIKLLAVLCNQSVSPFLINLLYSLRVFFDELEIVIFCIGCLRSYCDSLRIDMRGVIVGNLKQVPEVVCEGFAVSDDPAPVQSVKKVLDMVASPEDHDVVVRYHAFPVVDSPDFSRSVSVGVLFVVVGFAVHRVFEQT